MVAAMFLMVVLTFAVGVCAFVVRVRAVRAQKVKVRAFKLMSGDLPEDVQKTTRCFNNQFEVPVMFYVAALGYLALGHGDGWVGLSLAWVFVGTRYLHAYVLMTTNNILHRLTFFWIGAVAVLFLWGNLVWLAH